LNNNDTTITLEYSIFENIQSNDYIKVVFFDYDYIPIKGYINEDLNGTNIAGKDFEFIIK